MIGSGPLVSVIVPTKNSAPTLEACLKSIKDQTYYPIELIVVDNHSSDATREIARRFTDKVYVQGPERSAQRNYGAGRASGRYLLMVDSDMELDADVVKACSDEMLRNSAVCGVVIPEESFGAGIWARCKRLERSFYIGVPWIEAARFFTKTTYEAVGGYDEALVSGEDWDLAKRVEKIGKIARVGEVIHHNEGHISLLGALRKKYYYAHYAKAYLARNPEKSSLFAQAGPVQRYRLFLAAPGKLFARPLLGVAMLVMKTAEFAAGGLGYVLSAWPREKAEENSGSCPAGRQSGAQGRPFPARHGQEGRLISSKSKLGGCMLAIKSAQFDLKIMQTRTLPLRWRLRFVAKKYRTLLLLTFRRPARFEVGSLSCLIRDISGLGTLQSSIIDFFEDIVSSNVLGPRPLIVDVGANVGQFANAAKLFFPDARVVSFEPDPETYADLEVNTRDLRDVELHNVGLSDRDAALTFYRHELSVKSSFWHQADDMARHRGSTELQVRPLDAVLNVDDRPDLLKIDVEGFERQVLCGAWETVSRSRYVLIEVSLARCEGGGNLQLLRDIVEHAPNAAIVRFGRPLGNPQHPMCQDVLISVHGASDAAPSVVSLRQAAGS